MLYNKYGDAVFNVILRVIKDQSVAEELMQQVLLKVWNGIHNYDASKSGLYTWMSTIARNTAIDKYRLKSFQRNNKTENIDTHVYDYGATPNTGDQLDVASLVGGLDDKYRVIIQKLYLEGYSQRDLSEEMDIPLGTIKTRVRQGISLLRQELKSEKKLFFGIFMMILILILLWH